MNIIDLIVIVAYLALMVGVGFIFKSFNKDISDYFRGGCRGTWWLVGMSAFMNSFSAWTFTGAAGVAFQSGWSVAIIFIANSLGFFLNFICFAPWFRQLRATTAPEVIRKRFGPATQQFYAWATLPLGILYSSLHLYGLAIFSSAVFGFPVEAVIIIIGLVVLAYSTSGGSWAVMATDFLQSLILFPITVILACLCLRELGGWGEFLQAIHLEGLENKFSMINSYGEFAAAAFTWGWASAIIFKNIITANTMQNAVRYFSAKDGWEARKAALLATVLTLFGSFFWFIPPMTGRLLYADQINAVDISKPAEAAYAITSLNLLPTGMIGLVVVAMLTATMSSMDSGLNRNAAIFIKDILPALRRRFRKAQINDNRLLLGQSQRISLIFGLIIITLAFWFSQQSGVGIFEIMLNIGSYLAIPMAIPLLLGLLMKRVPSWAALAGIGLGATSSISLVLIKSFTDIDLNFQQTLFTTTSCSATGFILSSLAWHTTSAAYHQQVKDFFNEMFKPVDFENEVGGANDLRQLILIGTLATTIGALILPLLIYSRNHTDQIATLTIAATLISTGLAMVYLGKKSLPK
ncbi:hypothetical protein QEH59_09630 [Coraliomargarita sp. SDUM461004]|uniref:Na+:solute symporter n=1 Tax=Thalassobacterium sedimentorum TaxID=3041258 RepID=A0ABU1AIT0_9BACT|nr:hypothetical protein [Coraliomargarita sp. SDUM461004]MDQ8194686.1 hypothetical protein [Coraliomargarita sp. SDUM461004]